MYYIVVKPNHGLQYYVGTDFCVEDPMDFNSTITCRLERPVPIPAPEYVWNVTLNGIELPSDNVWYENGTLNLTGPVTLNNTSTIYVICDVSNIFGGDKANTSIRLCSKLNCSLNLAVAIVSDQSSDDSNMWTL